VEQGGCGGSAGQVCRFGWRAKEGSNACSGGGQELMAASQPVPPPAATPAPTQPLTHKLRPSTHPPTCVPQVDQHLRHRPHQALVHNVAGALLLQHSQEQERNRTGRQADKGKGQGPHHGWHYCRAAIVLLSFCSCSGALCLLRCDQLPREAQAIPATRATFSGPDQHTHRTCALSTKRYLLRHHTLDTTPAH
jgi:hypothetical protein